MRKWYLSRKSFTYEIYGGTSKAAHKVIQQRGLAKNSKKLKNTENSSKLDQYKEDLKLMDVRESFQSQKLSKNLVNELASCLFHIIIVGEQ